MLPRRRRRSWRLCRGAEHRAPEAGHEGAPAFCESGRRGAVHQFRRGRSAASAQLPHVRRSLCRQLSRRRTGPDGGGRSGPSGAGGRRCPLAVAGPGDGVHDGGRSRIRRTLPGLGPGCWRCRCGADRRRGPSRACGGGDERGPLGHDGSRADGSFDAVAASCNASGPVRPCADP